MTERERRRNAIQTFQNDLHTMQLRESQLRAQIREKVALQKSMDDMRQEIATMTVQSKVSRNNSFISLLTWILCLYRNSMS